MRRLVPVVLLAAAGFALRDLPGLAADTAYGEYLAAECATCHPSNGTAGAAPALRHLPYHRMVAALEEYRDGTRSHAAMRAVARSLGDAEIKALAAYFAGRS